MRAPLSLGFSESYAIENWTIVSPKNMKNFNVKIKILKHRLVLIWHQFLRNALVKVLFPESGIRMK